MLKLYLDIIMGRQLDRLMPFWQPANILGLHSVLIFMLLWQINIVVQSIFKEFSLGDINHHSV